MTPLRDKRSATGAGDRRSRRLRAFAALFFAISEGRIVQIFIPADPGRLRQIVAT